MRATLDRFGVSFDTWFSERDLYASGEVEAALAQLEKEGHSYRSNGALWMRSTDFGDDKDRVLIRADGEPTYLAADVAYHWDKLERGFELLIDVLGADHHGYAPRLKAVIAALGRDPDVLEPLIMQLVHLVEGGERAQMSKRSGEFVTLDELVDEIGVDATRWFMLWRSHDTTVDLDVELARRESSDNPVYYVQYAHARIASILRKAEDAGAAAPDASADAVARGRPRARGEGADQAPARIPRRGPRGGGAARPAPDLHLLDRGRGRLPRLLPRLPGGRRRGGGGRAGAAGALPADDADDRRLARAARDLRSRADVMLGRAAEAAGAGPGPARGSAPAGTLDREGLDAMLALLVGDRPRRRAGHRATRGDPDWRSAWRPRRPRRAARAVLIECELAAPGAGRAALGLDPVPGFARVPRARGRGAGDPPGRDSRRAGVDARRGAAGLHRRRRRDRARPRAARLRELRPRDRETSRRLRHRSSSTGRHSTTTQLPAGRGRPGGQGHRLLLEVARFRAAAGPRHGVVEPRA